MKYLHYTLLYGLFGTFFHLLIANNAILTDVHIKLNISVPLSYVDEEYLSIAIDPNLVREGWKKFDVRSSKLITLTKALSPTHFRFGGTDADFLIFNNTQTRSPIHNINFTMSVQDLDDLNFFVKNTGTRLLFCLNMLLRNSTSWDPLNALQLLKHSANTNYSNLYNLELGNEPNHIGHHWVRSLDPVQLAYDFAYLQSVIKSSPELNNDYKNALFVGPDVTRPIVGNLDAPLMNPYDSSSEEFLLKYLKGINSSKAQLDAITWHQYYINGRTATIYDFLSPKVLNYFPKQAEVIQFIAHKAGFQNTPIWMGETASAFGGGAPGLSDTYAAGFMWLDKLGLASKYGIKVIIRQSLYNGHYALLDEDLNPNTDFWLSYIFKILVGKEVLNVTQSHYSQKLRTYAHCTNYGKTSYPTGSITIFAMNLLEHTVKLQFDNDLNVDYCASYVLTPSEPDNLQSKFVALNGNTLILQKNNTLPFIKPTILKKGSPFTLPRKSYGFFVLAGYVSSMCS